MAEGRMMSKSVAADDRLNAMSRDAMLLYLMAVPHLDRDGLMDGRPRVLWSTVAPLQDEWMTAVDGLIAEWIAVGLVVRYTGDDGRPVLFFLGFAKNQRGMVYKRERPSKFACPPGLVRTAEGLRAEGEAQAARDEVVQQSCNTHAMDMHPSCNGREASDEMRAPARDEVMQSAGAGRAEDQDQHQIEDQDQQEEEEEVEGDGGAPSHHHTGFGMGGSAEGGHGPTPANGHVSTEELVHAFTPEQLRAAAYELGRYLQLDQEWTNFEGYLRKREPGTLAMLIEWIEFYSDMPQKAYNRIENLPGLVRSHLNKGERATLTDAQRKALTAAVMNALIVTEEASE